MKSFPSSLRHLWLQASWEPGRRREEAESGEWKGNPHAQVSAQGSDTQCNAFCGSLKTGTPSGTTAVTGTGAVLGVLPEQRPVAKEYRPSLSWEWTGAAQPRGLPPLHKRLLQAGGQAGYLVGLG